MSSIKLFGSIAIVLAVVIPGVAAQDQFSSKADLLMKANTLTNQVAKLGWDGKYAQAIPLAKEAHEIQTQVLGEKHPDTVATLDTLGFLCGWVGDYAAAESLFKRALDIRNEVVGHDHLDVATSLSNLSGLYRIMGNYAAAEPLAKRALEIREQRLGSDDATTAKSLNDVAMLRLATGNYAEAESLYQRALNIHEKSLGPNHPDTAASLNNLALLYNQTGKHLMAEPLYKRALAILEMTLGADHPLTATALSNLALVYSSMENHAAAEPLFQRALKVREKVLGPDHPDTAVSLNNLAELYRQTGKHSIAEPLYKRALAICEKSFGSEHASTLAILSNLALVYQDMGNYAAAQPLSERALKIREKTIGPDHPDIAVSLNNLAELCRSTGNYTAAEPLLKRALAIWEKTLGHEHPNVGACLFNLTALLAAQGKPEPALEMARRAWRIQEKQRDEIFAFATEREQMVLAGYLEGTVAGILSITTQHLAHDLAARSLAFSTILSNKGRILESLARRQLGVVASNDPERKRLFNDWQAAGTELFRATSQNPKPGQIEAYLALIADLGKRREAAEQALARASAQFASEHQASHITPADVDRTLPAGSALVEFVHSYSINFQATRKEDLLRGANYVAFVLRGGSASKEPDVALMPLGSEEKIEDAAKKWRKAAAADEHGRRSDKAVIEEASRELAALVWNPIVPALGDCRKVYISPDGELAFVSFAALPGREPDRFVIDDYDINYVATGRDLRRVGYGKGGAPVLVGAPDFERNAAGVVSSSNGKSLLASRSDSLDVRSFAGMKFSPLPGSRAEVETIARLLQQQQGPVIPLLLTDDKAEKRVVKSVEHPTILHLATHGFFLPNLFDELMRAGRSKEVLLWCFASTIGPQEGYSGSRLSKLFEAKNAMHRSGIALAGANDTIRGQRDAGDNDGILTAEEVAGMDLWGTKMVVISACESGLGEARSGEGVFGLRRAFTIAGAQSLVMSLWSVSDEPTRDLMTSLYRHLPAERTPQRALLAAQREWIAKKRAAGVYPHPVHWASFVASGIGVALEQKDRK